MLSDRTVSFGFRLQDLGFRLQGLGFCLQDVEFGTLRPRVRDLSSNFKASIDRFLALESVSNVSR